jgi:hypothetical protein
VDVDPGLRLYQRARRRAHYRAKPKRTGGFEVLPRIVRRLAREPAAVGALVASVLPALTAFGVISLDEQQIGVAVVAVNAVVGFAIRFLVTPASDPAR